MAVVRGKDVEWFFTANIAQRGLYIRMPNAPGAREVFDVRVLLPPENTAIELHATTCHVQAPADLADNPGVGVQFFGFGGLHAARWRQFVREVRQRHPETIDPARALDLVPEDQSDAHRRLAGDAGARVRIRLGSVEALYRLYRENLSKGVVLVPASAPLAEGAPMELRLVHPVTAAELRLEGAVLRNVSRARFQGAVIALDALTPRRQEELIAFVNADIPLSVEL